MDVQLTNGSCEGAWAQVKLNDEGMRLHQRTWLSCQQYVMMFMSTELLSPLI